METGQAADDLKHRANEGTPTARPATSKRAYRRPELTEYGNVRALTRSGVGSKKEPRTSNPRPK